MKGRNKLAAMVVFSILAFGLLPALALLLPYEQPAALGPARWADRQGKLDVFPDKGHLPIDASYVRMGDEYRDQRSYSSAEDAYLKALSYNTTNAAAYFGLGEADFWLERWEDALHAFETSIQHGYPEPALAYRGMGWSYYNLGIYPQARGAFEQAVELAPDLADAYNGLGWVSLQEDRCDGGIQFFERALALDPRFLEAQRGLSICIRMQQDRVR